MRCVCNTHINDFFFSSLLVLAAATPARASAQQRGRKRSAVVLPPNNKHAPNDDGHSHLLTVGYDLDLQKLMKHHNLINIFQPLH